jgi:SAM-dependent methyltransferase
VVVRKKPGRCAKNGACPKVKIMGFSSTQLEGGMSKPSVFEYQAQVGLTKHMGGLAATETLMRLCEIEPDHEVLEVGCGVGQTSALLAKRCGCRLVGVDIREGMIEFARKRARRHGLSDRTEFRLGDISNLPFEEERFDVAFGESITVFATDHAKAIMEYARVLKPGGAVGINETIWLKPPPPEILAWLSQDLGGEAHTDVVEGWKALFEKAGLRIETAQANPINIRQEARGLLQRYGLGGFLGAMGRMLGLYLQDPEYRAFSRETRDVGVTPKNITEYLGYGLFVARKPTHTT